MNRIAIATDSVACLPCDVAAQHGIRTIPVRVRVGDVEYEDLEACLPPDVVLRLQSEATLDTTPWPPEHYCRVYLDMARDADSILHVAAFSRFTSTLELARAGARMAEGASPGLRISLLDSATTGMAQGFIALAAAREAARGADLAAVTAAAERVKASARSIFALDSLAHLARTGRVGRLYGWASSVLRLTPVVSLYGGAEHPVALVRSPLQVKQRLATFVKEEPRGPGELQLAVMESGRPTEAAALARMLCEQLDVVECHVVSFTPVMQLVAGPGVLGVAFHTAG